MEYNYMRFTEYLRLNETATTVQPKDLGELRQIITDTVKEKGLDCDLNSSTLLRLLI